MKKKGVKGFFLIILVIGLYPYLCIIFMFLTFLFELKKKQKKEENQEKKEKKSLYKQNTQENKNTKDKGKKKNKRIKKKKNKSQKSLIFKKDKNKKDKGILYKGLKGFIGTPHFIFFVAIFFILFCRSVLLLGSKTLYLDGHFEYYSETSSIFIADCTKIKRSNSLRDKEVGDYIYYQYDKKSDSWKIEKKGGLKLKIIDINDYYIFTEIENLDNTIFENDFLKAQNIYKEANISVPLKHLFNNYEIYFSLNDGINLLRDEYGIYKEDKKLIDILEENYKENQNIKEEDF